MTLDEVLGLVLVTVLVGAVISFALGRLLVPHTARFGLIATVVVGIVAAFCGGLLGKGLHWSSLPTLVAQVLIAAAGVLLFRRPSSGR